MGILPDLCSQCQGLTYGREAGRPICANCLLKFRQDQEAGKPGLKCPVDGNVMVNEVRAGAIIIDRCVSCKGVWLQAAELAVVREASSEGSALAAGIMLGIAMD
jgi:hypothetical protein